MNQPFSKIWMGVILIISVVGGIFVGKFLIPSMEISQKEIMVQNNEISLPFPQSPEKIGGSIEQKLTQLLLAPNAYVGSGDYLLPDAFVNIGVDFGDIVDLNDPIQLKEAENDAVRLVHLDLISKFLHKYKDVKGYYPKTNGATNNISIVQSGIYRELVQHVPEAFFMPEDPGGNGRWYQYWSDGKTFTLTATPEIQDSRNSPAYYFGHCAQSKKFGEYYAYVCEGK